MIECLVDHLESKLDNTVDAIDDLSRNDESGPPELVERVNDIFDLSLNNESEPLELEESKQ